MKENVNENIVLLRRNVFCAQNGRFFFLDRRFYEDLRANLTEKLYLCPCNDKT